MLTVYKASAGSGKTFTLTRKYIQLLLGVKNPDGSYRLNHPDFGPVHVCTHRHILAITFTNKATEEMKERIVRELNLLATDVDKSKYTEEFCRLFGCTPQQLSKAAYVAMRQLLSHYGDFNVSTIDSFFQQVLRALAYELDYPGDYEVELSSNAVVSDAVGIMMNMFNYGQDKDTDGAFARTLRQYMRRKRDEGTGFNLFNRRGVLYSEVVRNTSALFDEKYQQVAKPFEEWISQPGALDGYIKALNDMQQAAKDKLKALVGSYRDAVIGAGLNPEKDLNSYVQKSLTAMENGAVFKTVEGVKNLEAIFGFNIAGAFKGKAFAKNIEDTPTLDILADIGAEMCRANAMAIVCEGLARDQYTYRFMNVVRGHIEQYRRDNNIILLADTNRLLERVTASGNVPFVYEKMGVMLHHFLIDEFQDTSRMQWSNLLPMVQDSMAAGHDSLIIGDEKQSIYRFRNSDSELLHSEVQRQFGDNVELCGKTPAQNTNWRSAPGIVRFNNTLFAALAAQLEVGGYENVHQNVAAKNAGKTSYIHLFDVSAEGRDSSIAGQADMVLGQIRRQHEAGYPWRKICVMAATGDVVAEVAARLVAAGIPIATDEALRISSAPSVAIVTGILDLMLRPADNISRAGNIAAFVSRFNYIYSQELSADPDGDPGQAAVKSVQKAYRTGLDEKVSPLADIMAERPSNLSSLIDIIIAKRISPQQRLTDMPYLTAFHDAVITYRQTYGESVYGFLRWWRARSKMSLSVPESTDAVRIMTIHKSKGLEFDCVHIVNGDYSLLGNTTRQETLWVNTADHFGGAVPAGFPPAMRITVDKANALVGSPFHELCRANHMARLTDGLNRNYVAYTRAGRELCVYLKAGEGFGKQLGQAIAACGPTDNPLECDIAGARVSAAGSQDVDPSMANDVILGAPTLCGDGQAADSPAADAGSQDDSQPEVMTVTHTGVCLRGSLEHVTRVTTAINQEPDADFDLEPSAIDNDQPFSNDATRRGERLHSVLSRVHNRNFLNRELRKATRRGMDKDEAEALRSHFNHPAVAKWVDRWFAPGVRALSEASVFLPEYEERDPAKAMCRPDRIVWLDSDTIQVVDFKFTAETDHAHDSQFPRPAHRRQVSDYARVLRTVYSHATVHAALWYVDRNQVAEVE